MSNELIAGLAGMRAGLATMVRETPAAGLGGADILKLDKGDGTWIYGADAEELGATLVAVNPASFAHGWISWLNSSVEHEEMVPVAQPLPDKGELPTPTDRYDRQLAVQMVTMDSARTPLIYKTTALGGIEAVNKLAQEIIARLDAGETKLVPVLKLESSSYKHKKWGRIYKPLFNIVEWRADHDTAPPAKEAEAPKQRRRRG